MHRYRVHNPHVVRNDVPRKPKRWGAVSMHPMLGDPDTPDRTARPEGRSPYEGPRLPGIDENAIGIG